MVVFLVFLLLSFCSCFVLDFFFIFPNLKFIIRITKIDHRCSFYLYCFFALCSCGTSGIVGCLFFFRNIAWRYIGRVFHFKNNSSNSIGISLFVKLHLYCFIFCWIQRINFCGFFPYTIPPCPAFTQFNKGVKMDTTCFTEYVGNWFKNVVIADLIL